MGVQQSHTTFLCYLKSMYIKYMLCIYVYYRVGMVPYDKRILLFYRAWRELFSFCFTPLIICFFFIISIFHLVALMGYESSRCWTNTVLTWYRFHNIPNNRVTVADRTMPQPTTAAYLYSCTWYVCRYM